MKVIPGTRRPDEGYSRNTSTWWRLFQEHVDLMKVIPGTRRPDEGYSRNMSTVWRLFQEHVDLMKVIPGTCRPDEGYSRNTSSTMRFIHFCYCRYSYFWWTINLRGYHLCFGTVMVDCLYFFEICNSQKSVILKFISISLGHRQPFPIFGYRVQPFGSLTSRNF
jgi:hypothetical protein